MKDRILVGIPTRDRPEYLCGVLATLMFQIEHRWDLFIVDSSSKTSRVRDHIQVKRFTDTLTALGHKVEFIDKPNFASRSSVVAVNSILVEAALRGYGYLFFVDDDHVVPPDTLSKLKEFIDEHYQEKSPVLISGVTPWMHKVWEGAAGPGDIHSPEDGEEPSDLDIGLNGELQVGTSLFYRWTHPPGRPIFDSTLASDANFMMKPDLRILQSDLGPSSLHAFSVWFLQLQVLLGYRLYFDVSLNVWHVAAPSGGVRDEDGNHVKDKEADNARKELLKYWVRNYL